MFNEAATLARASADLKLGRSIDIYISSCRAMVELVGVELCSVRAV